MNTTKRLFRRMAEAGLAVGWAVAVATSGAAQVVPIPTGTQDLRFGTVLPGLPTSIPRTDAVNTGQFDVRGRRWAEIRIDLTLPPSLISGGGATMPIQFGPNDGGYAPFPFIFFAQAFDPNAPLIVRIQWFGRVYIYLGGTVLPAPSQATGTYQATITLTAAYTGN